MLIGVETMADNEAGKAIHDLVWFLAYGQTREDELKGCYVLSELHGDPHWVRHHAEEADWGYEVRGDQVWPN